MKYNKKTWIIFAVVFALNFILLGVYAYAFYMVSNKNEKVAIASQELERQLIKEGDMSSIAKTVKDTKKQRQKLDTYFIMRDDIVNFTQKIESLESISGVQLTITGLNIQDDTLSLGLKSKGKFIDTIHLMLLIENLPFKLDISKAYINKIAGAGIDSNQWNGSFKVTLSGFSNK